jgi:hypothetical protein
VLVLLVPSYRINAEAYEQTELQAWNLSSAAFLCDHINKYITDESQPDKVRLCICRALAVLVVACLALPRV